MDYSPILEYESDMLSSLPFLEVLVMMPPQAMAGRPCRPQLVSDVKQMEGSNLMIVVRTSKRLWHTFDWSAVSHEVSHTISLITRKRDVHHAADWHI